MNAVKFYTCSSEQLQEYNVDNGAIYVVTDTKELYVDINNQRLNLSGSRLTSGLDWDSIANKPFSTIGSNLTVIEDALISDNFVELSPDEFDETTGLPSIAGENGKIYWCADLTPIPAEEMSKFNYSASALIPAENNPINSISASPYTIVTTDGKRKCYLQLRVTKQGGVHQMNDTYIGNMSNIPSGTYKVVFDECGEVIKNDMAIGGDDEEYYIFTLNGNKYPDSFYTTVINEEDQLTFEVTRTRGTAGSSTYYFHISLYKQNGVRIFACINGEWILLSPATDLTVDWNNIINKPDILVDTQKEEIAISSEEPANGAKLWIKI